MVSSSSLKRRLRIEGDFDGVGDIGIARGPLLLARPSLHGVNISAIEKRFVRLWIVALHFFDEIILPHGLTRSRLCFNLHGLDSPSTTWCNNKSNSGAGKRQGTSYAAFFVLSRNFRRDGFRRQLRPEAFGDEADGTCVAREKRARVMR